MTGYFDENGICLSVIGGHGDYNLPYAYSAPVAKDASPSTVWYDIKAKKAKKSTHGTLKLPASVALNAKVSVTVPANCVAIMNGKPQTSEFDLDTSMPGVIMIDLRGRLYGEFIVDVDGYAEARVREYGPVTEQLDMIYHEGVDAWKAKIQAIKSKYPKPQG